MSLEDALQTALKTVVTEALAEALADYQAPEPSLTLTAGDVARHLNVSITHARSLIKRGTLPSVNVGARTPRVPRAALVEYINNQ